MKIKALFYFLILFCSNLVCLYGQEDLPVPDKDQDVRINRALDYFGEGDYQRAISILESVLLIDPENGRAADLLASIRELYKMESGGSGRTPSDNPYETEKPDFSLDEGEEQAGPEEEELEKPDFSLGGDEDDLLLPEQTRSIFEFSLSPNLVHPWDIGEDSVVFPDRGSYSGSFSAELDFFPGSGKRIIGFSGAYSLFLLDPQWGDFSDGRLHVADVMFSFRTFFLEEVDNRVIFKLSAGYRGYFSAGYDFFEIQRDYLNGFNMGINLEGPLIYLFFERDFFKRIIFDLDMNLLFFPEINTLNLFDFRINTRLQFRHFALGVHFGAYSVITAEDVKYIWMNGINISFSF